MQYSQQNSPQPAYVMMDRYGVVTADYDGNVGGGVSSDDFHGITLRFEVSPLINGAVLHAFLMADEAKSLLSIIDDGHSIDWNGNNWVGTLSDEAQQATEDFNDLLSDFSDPDSCLDEAWNVGDYYGSSDFSDIWSDSETLAVAASSIENDAESYGGGLVRIDGDCEEYLLETAFDIFSDNKNGLSKNHLDALIAAGKIDEDEAKEYMEGHS